MSTRNTNLSIRRYGFTLIELLVVIAVIGTLVTILLPAVQAARESSRSTSCKNHLRQVGIALLNRTSDHKALPIGASSGPPSFGQSWWVSLLPYLEQSTLYERLDVTGPNNGNIVFNLQNGLAIDGVIIDVMACPSNPFLLTWPTGAIQVMMPSYVGIAGSTNHDNFPERRVSDCCIADANRGQISAGGVLIPNRAVRLQQVTDGLSNTLAVGECSDYITDSNGILKRIDGSFPVGWLTGTVARGVPPDYSLTFARMSYNITTIRYPINTRSYDQPGIRDDHGANNPLISAHPGGINALLLDGAVRFLSEDTDVLVLKMLATRDDGGLMGSIGD